MEVSKVTRCLSGTGLFLFVLFAQGSFAGNAKHVAKHENSGKEFSAQIGRASLTVEDLKTLLGQSTRDPSSQDGEQKQDVTAPSNPLKITLDRASARRLARVLAELEIKRIDFERKVTGESEAEIERLRSERTKIQTSRLSSTESKDAKLSRDLFDSFLSEANSKAKIEDAMLQFDQAHLVSIDFLETEEYKSVQTIYIGEDLAWSAETKKKQSYARK